VDALEPAFLLPPSDAPPKLPEPIPPEEAPSPEPTPIEPPLESLSLEPHPMLYSLFILQINTSYNVSPIALIGPKYFPNPTGVGFVH
jgi:hypothetical protein